MATATLRATETRMLMGEDAEGLPALATVSLGENREWSEAVADEVYRYPVAVEA